MWITDDCPDLWSSLHLPQKMVGDQVPINVMSTLYISFIIIISDIQF